MLVGLSHNGSGSARPYLEEFQTLCRTEGLYLFEGLGRALLEVIARAPGESFS